MFAFILLTHPAVARADSAASRRGKRGAGHKQLPQGTLALLRQEESWMK